MQRTWSEALTRKYFVVALVTTLVLVIALTQIVPYFFNNILLPKPGVTLSDPILNLFQPKDWSVEIFIVLYLTVLASVAFNFKKPDTILLGLQTYTTINFIRLATLYFFTLEAPEGIIPLNDPLINTIAYGQQVFLKDLFFSGHIASLSVLFFIEERKIFRWMILLAILIVAVLLASQRVHYTVDMVFALLVAWTVFSFFKKLNRKYHFADKND